MTVRFSKYLVSGLLFMGVHAQGREKARPELDLVRGIPLETGQMKIPEKFISSKQVETELARQRQGGSGNLMALMETIRRSYRDLSADERDVFAKSILKGYQASPDNTMDFFIHGYTQVVYRRSKGSLRLLKVADDRLRTSASALAYAMAVAEVDANTEKHPAEEYTERKMHVTWSLNDATARDQRTPSPGFSASIGKVLERLRPMKGYETGLASINASLQRMPASSPRSQFETHTHY